MMTEELIRKQFENPEPDPFPENELWYLELGFKPWAALMWAELFAVAEGRRD
jgi:hypothetical protein